MSLTSFIFKLIRHGPNIMIYPGAFEPYPRDIYLPSAYNLPYEDITLTTIDRVKVKGYLLLQPEKSKRVSDKIDTPTSAKEPLSSEQRPTVLMFHGNMDNIGFTLPLARIFYTRMGCNVFMLSPRGYGLSGGRPSTKGLQRDAEAALSFLMTHPRLSATPKILYGQSMGGALAIDLASRHPQEVTALIVENTFMSLRKLIPEVTPLFAPLAPFFRQWNSLVRISRLPSSVSLLLLSGSKDEVIPPHHMKRLWEAASPPGEGKEKRMGRFVEFQEGEHNDTWDQPGYWDAVAEFVTNLPGVS